MSFKRLTASFLAAVVLALPFAAFAQTERGHDYRRRRRFVEGGGAWRVDRRYQCRHERHDERRIVRFRQLQRGEPAARHVSNRGDAPGIPDIEGRGDNPERGHDRSRRCDAESRLDQRVRSRRRRERDGVDRRRQGCDHRVEPPDRRAPARRRWRDAQSRSICSARCPKRAARGSTTSLGGGQGGSFGATLDGISVNTNRQGDTVETAFLTPSLEAITEFQVETNGFKPEFGQAGGGSITFASKSGTNNLSGIGLRLLPSRLAGQEGILRGRPRAFTSRATSADRWAGL